MQLADRGAVSRFGTPLVVAVVAVVAGIGLTVGLNGYFAYLGVSVVVAAIALLGLGVVTGSAGMISLCQLTFGAIGAWVVSALNVADAPGGFLFWLLLGGLAAGVVGVLIGLPALRLRGINLAVVTLGLAAAADVTLVEIQFPGTTDGVSVDRPSFVADDNAYFLLCVLVLIVCALLVHFLRRGPWGSSWAAVAFSERGTAAAGASVRMAKLSAFAVSATLGGLSGGLLTAQVGFAFPTSFAPLQSLALYVLAIMSGAHLIDMAVFGAVLWVAVPELLKRWGVPQDWGYVIFGLLGLQALAGRGNLGTAIRELRRRRSRASAGVRITALDEEPPRLPPGEPVLVVRGLSVTFGQVKALSGVDLAVPKGGVLGVIGPNGAGKSTLVDAISGFLPQAEGIAELADRPLTGNPTQRARSGLRRTFQQDRVPAGLTIEAYVRFVARRRPDAAEVAAALEFFGCPPAATPLERVDVGARRLVEVVGHLMAKPQVLLLDEPAAGLPHEEHVAFGERLRQVPARFGVSVLIIEHDLDLVRSVCDTLTVLDFGEVLASGPQAEVLADPAVLKAYLGETEML
ncbi:branched-chain amino acid ABC transporter ATP-binding protein/permease [Amycolatopsis rubida]|uniref:Branched-chain amino acid ABC transporter ATP-binding protein/permease n=1 Tax=Amycolatopsis rubida TaxID=112413 RepID=A0ABX0BQX3_9PSEU|nr:MULTISPECIES: ATP-binding cassette domain-containing protein [Amycolatopsis]MYW91013.1 ATP-binding cassette domain-containing protein [Amycolatopsis rubida]NEC55998.1 branched-chain amino acid ABC transporter ATP-binding protein/permease [Amycolatopsis rubida]OAP25913.1 Autoinducer 2 import ATP-binding protein LsrA [Amycolatopsis sp. M39]